ncbi:MAG: protoporphyrinogen oxidase [Blastopirellula sp. JB062]
MDAAVSQPPRIAVIGGGISGLAAANRLHELSPSTEIRLFESAERLGGVLETRRDHQFLVEQSADTFITNVPWGVDLCRRIGIEHDLLPTNDALRKAFVVRQGRLVEVPEGFLLMAPGKAWPILRTPILSWQGKLRLAWEYFVPPRQNLRDESLKSFVVRRLGVEAYERLVQPLIGGIYTADPEKLSVAATMKQFVEMERRHGGLIRGMRRRQSREGQSDSGARYSMFVAPRGGMSDLVDAIAKRLPDSTIRLQSPVTSVTCDSNRNWHIACKDMTETFAGVIVAAPAPAAANLLRRQAPSLAQDLAQISYAGCAIAILGVRRDQIARPCHGFGFVVPEVEKRRILAASFASHKFPGRAPDEDVLIRVFVGGACHPEMNHLPDRQLRKIVSEELSELIGLKGEPQTFSVRRWTAQMPQYHVGHLDLVERIEQATARLPGLALAGNAYHGVGVPTCIRSGELAAERLTEQLSLNQVKR